MNKLLIISLLVVLFSLFSCQKDTGEIALDYGYQKVINRYYMPGTNSLNLTPTQDGGVILRENIYVVIGQISYTYFDKAGNEIWKHLEHEMMNLGAPFYLPIYSTIAENEQYFILFAPSDVQLRVVFVDKKTGNYAGDKILPIQLKNSVKELRKHGLFACVDVSGGKNKLTFFDKNFNNFQQYETEIDLFDIQETSKSVILGDSERKIYAWSKEKGFELVGLLDAMFTFVDEDLVFYEENPGGSNPGETMFPKLKKTDMATFRAGKAPTVSYEMRNANWQRTLFMGREVFFVYSDMSVNLNIMRFNIQSQRYENAYSLSTPLPQNLIDAQIHPVTGDLYILAKTMLNNQIETVSMLRLKKEKFS